MRKLIVTCDDCGLSEGINQAVIELHQKQMVTTASIMTNFAATQHALTLLTRYPSLECGIHLNLTDGFPVTKSPSPSPLTQRDGRFRGRPSLFRQAIFPTPSFLSQVKVELAAQFEVFTQANIRPRHVTTHIHFHALPALRKIVYELASQYGVDWIRADALHSAVIPFNLFLRKNRGHVEQSASVMTPDYIVAAKYWMRFQPERLAHEIETLDGVIEFVVHPCISVDPSYPIDIYYQPHERFNEMHYFESVMNCLNARSAA
jgi:predicted glycoside hydrolase/deacetylase ChbG (UPF0249 family)